MGFVTELVDNAPVGIGAVHEIDAPIRSDRLLEDNGPRPTLLRQDTSQGSETQIGSDPGPVFDPTPAVASAGQAPFQHRDANHDHLVWGEITRLLCEPDLIRTEIDRRLRSMRETDPAARRSETLAVELTRAQRAISRLVDAYQEAQITLDELRDRMPEQRPRESSLRAEQDAIGAEINDAATCLKLVETIEAFTGRLTHRLDDMNTNEQERILQLLVRDVLIVGEDETVTIRHSIPLLPAAGDTPGLQLHTGRHGVPCCRPSPASSPTTGKARLLLPHRRPQDSVTTRSRRVARRCAGQCFAWIVG